MPYSAGRKMVFNQTTYAKGEQIPEDVIATVAPGRRESLLRTGLVRYVPPEVAEAEVEEAKGDICPECGEGPFQRLAKHMDAKHPVAE